MSVALMARQFKPASHLLDPSSVSGLVGRWRASDLSGLADGAAIASWTDVTGANTVTQATGAKQPLKQTDGNGRTLVRFDKTAAQVLQKASPTGLPSSGAFTVLIVAKHNAFTGGNANCLVEYAGASVNKGWSLGAYNGNQMWMQDFSVFAQSGGVNTNKNLYVYKCSGTATKQRYNNRVEGDSPALTPLAGADLLSIGASGHYTTWNSSADIYEVLIWNRQLADSEIDSLRLYFSQTHGLTALGSRYNAANYIATSPTADASSTCIEPDVLYFPAALWGYKYWLAFVPFGSALGANENPHVMTSNDNATYAVPTSGSNPVVPARTSDGNNADPRLYYDGTAMYLYWKVEGSASSDGIWYKTTTDGVTWSAATRMLTAAANTCNEPHVLYDGTQYVLYLQNYSATPWVVTRRTGSSPTGPWSAPTNCTGIGLAGTNGAWHYGVSYAHGKWLMVFSDSATAGNLWIASSSDGVTWTTAPVPVIVPAYAGGTTWDTVLLYRGLLLPPDDTTSNWRLWYSGGPSTSGMHLGYTEIPSSEIP